MRLSVLRKDSNQFYATELKTSYNEADKLQLLPNDKIFVYENINYRNSFTYRMEGEINKPGTYSFKEGISVSDAIELAEGITDFSSFDNIVVFQEYTELDENDEEITKSESVGNVDGSFLLGSNSVVVALPFENVVRVEGNVYNPGLVAFSKGLTIYKAIEQAGGYMPYSIKNRVYVRRADGEIEKASLFLGRSKRIYPGDTIVVPVDPNPSDFDITTFVSDISTTLANIAAILLIVDNQTN
jgi:protein involved in polysaccharide export with SLBB domain